MSAPLRPRLPRTVSRSRARRASAALPALIGALLAGSLLASCDDVRDPTSARTPDRPAAAVAATQSDVTAQGTIPLPVNQSIASSGIAFGITQTGTGQSGVFKIANSANTATALFAQSNGSGKSLYVKAIGTGVAGTFQNTNTGSSASALVVSTAGRGTTLSVTSSGTGAVGSFENTYAGNGTSTLLAINDGNGPAAQLFSNNPNSGADAVFIQTIGTGWAGHFRGSGGISKGVLIEVPPGLPGLQVVGGTKNAVVGTASGARELYTEEATEVWFADYGFGRLTNGRARILLDPTFAQTIDVDAPYHVFVQPYGDADMYVRDRTPLGFEVVFRGGNDREAEFSYRVVAKRRGFDAKRLEPAPWADHAAGLELH